jgi:hypothetical protein
MENARQLIGAKHSRRTPHRKKSVGANASRATALAGPDSAELRAAMVDPIETLRVA